jgi:hypothetical protein
MANRSYLYTIPGIPPDNGPTPKPIRGLSEWSWDVPISHLLMVGENTTVCPSALWEPRIGIVGEFEKGKNLLLRFLRHLQSSGKMSKPDAYAAAVDETARFLSLAENRSTHVLLEAGEIFALSDDPPEQLAEDYATFRIGPLVRDVSIVLKTPAPMIFGPGSKDWVNDLVNDWEETLGIGNWTNTLFQSFD